MNAVASAATPLPITVIILAFNEEIHIERCLQRLAGWVERIVVIDSFSTDPTVAIAQALGAEVLQHPWKNHADQFRWGLDAAAPTTALGDADRLRRIFRDPPFPIGCENCLPALRDDVTGIIVSRKFIFRERWIRHGRYYPTMLLRIWRNGAGDVEQRWMDEHIVLNRGRAMSARGRRSRRPQSASLDHWIAKHNRYATLAMIDYLNREVRLFDEDERIGATDGAAKRNRYPQKFGLCPGRRSTCARR